MQIGHVNVRRHIAMFENDLITSRRPRGNTYQSGLRIEVRELRTWPVDRETQ